MRSFSLLFLSCLLFFCSCSDKDLKITLELSGENRAELEKVISYYSKNKEDSLKLKAAKYLITNAQYHWGIPNYLVDNNGVRVESTEHWDKSRDTLVYAYAKQNNFKFKQEKPVNDLHALTADFLIENIDLAFEVWQKPWAKHISFDEFCEYILPYRVKNEPLSNWRRHFYDLYIKELEDSVKNPTAVEVAKYYSKKLEERATYGFFTDKLYKPFIDPFESEKIFYLRCEPLAAYGIAAMRAVGIPVSYIDTKWRFAESAHAAIMLYSTDDDTTKHYKFSITDPMLTIGRGEDTMASYCVWRDRFGVNKEHLKIQNSLKQDFPMWLIPTLKDEVTSVYCITRDITLKDCIHFPSDKT